MRSIAILVGAVLVGTTLNAQEVERNPRHGFWISAGLGAGSEGAKCDLCNTTRANGPAGYVRLGTAVGRRFLLGAELAGWSITALGVDQGMGAILADFYWYPGKAPLYLKFGVGGASYSWDNGTTRSIDAAPAVSLGIGYEFRVARNLSIAPFLNTIGSSAVKRTTNGTEVSTNGDVRRDMVQLGVAVTLH